MQNDRGTGAGEVDEPETVWGAIAGSVRRFLERGGGAALCGGSSDECGITIEYIEKTGVRLLGEREFQYGNRTVGSSIFRYVKANSDVVKE